MAGLVKMELLFGAFPVLLLSRLPAGTAEGAGCSLEGWVITLSSGGTPLGRLTVPHYLRGRLDGLDRITAVEVINETPARKFEFPITRPAG